MPKRRILIVDDLEDSAASLAFLLEGLGHEVKFTTLPAKALEIASTFLPEFVFVDIGMPKMNGWELAKKIKSNPLTAAARIFAVTGYAQPEDKQRSHAAGIEAHLLKPLEFRLLADLLSSKVPAR